MIIVIGCEKSGVLSQAIALRGHTVISCDKKPSELWSIDQTDNLDDIIKHLKEQESVHFIGDVEELIYNISMDMIVAFPPCTYMCNTGVQHLFKEPGRLEKMYEATRLFSRIRDHPCKKIAIENPIMPGYAKERIGVQQTQIIQPWMFGHMRRKATCLWLKGLPKLIETDNVFDEMLKLPIKEQKEIFYMSKSKNRSDKRSRLFQGIGDAMANQWG